MRKNNIPVSGQLIELMATRFRMLGEPHRLRILQVLETREHAVNEIVEMLQANQSNVSRHLNALFNAGIVSRRRDGNTIFYAIADPVILKICHLVCHSATEEAKVKLTGIIGKSVVQENA